MPSSYTTSLRFEQQFTGENVNTWGVRLNNALARVDDAIAGYVALTVPTTGGYSVTSANDNSSADEARRAHLKLNGSPSLDFTLTIPSVAKSYWIWNNTAKVATISTGAGDTVTIEAADIAQVWCDGTNVKTTRFGGYNLKDYITSMTAAAGAVPGTTGHLGKFLKVTADGGPSTWQQVQSTDLGDYLTNILGLQVALAVAL